MTKKNKITTNKWETKKKEGENNKFLNINKKIDFFEKFFLDFFCLNFKIDF